MPEQNQTSDETISQLAVDEEWIVVTKDSDFVHSFLLLRRPPRLLVSTGNIGNRELEKLFLDNNDQITASLESYDYIELSRQHVSCHV